MFLQLYNSFHATAYEDTDGSFGVSTLGQLFYQIMDKITQ